MTHKVRISRNVSQEGRGGRTINSAENEKCWNRMRAKRPPLSGLQSATICQCEGSILISSAIRRDSKESNLVIWLSINEEAMYTRYVGSLSCTLRQTRLSTIARDLSHGFGCRVVPERLFQLSSQRLHPVCELPRKGNAEMSELSRNCSCC